MGVRFGTFATSTQQNALPSNAFETVIYTTGPIILAVDSAAVLLLWAISIGAGTGTTALVIHIRRGTTTAGTSIGAAVWTQTVVAGNIYGWGGVYFDLFPAGDTPYSLTVSQTGCTSAGTLEGGLLAAFVL